MAGTVQPTEIRNRRGNKRVIALFEFEATSGIESTVGILLGRTLSVRRTTDSIREYAGYRQFVAPTLEVGCLVCSSVCDNFLRKSSLSRIAVMHNPVLLEGLYRAFLTVTRKRADVARRVAAEELLKCAGDEQKRAAAEELRETAKHCDSVSGTR